MPPKGKAAAAEEEVRPRGSWEGTTVTEADLDKLRRSRRIPSVAVVACRAAEGEEVPAPRDGEVVVFASHFFCGFGLPVSPFLRRFLDHFGLQLHQLGANAMLVLSAYAVFCEAYLGIWPCIDLWAKLFFLKPQGTSEAMQACGAASIYVWPSGGIPKIPKVDSAKKWHQTFFYEKNVQPAEG